MEKGLKLFGVRIFGEEEEEELIRKSASMGNLAGAARGVTGGGGGGLAGDHYGGDQGYLSDGGLLKSSRKRRRERGHERKRGIPWTEEEHRTFLAGLEKLGKGDWRGISRNFVTTRTPTQVASHAQKYFLRQSNPSKKKRRSSLFDVVITDQVAAPESSKRTGEVIREENNLVAISSQCLNLSDYTNHAKENTSSNSLKILGESQFVESRDLELRIAPPNYGTIGTIGAISVV